MSNLMCGTATTNGGLIIKIPAGRAWQGSINLSASVVVGSSGAAVNASARVSVVGVNADPAPGDYLRLDLSAPASVLGAVGTGASDTALLPSFLVAAPPENDVSLVLNTTNTTTQSASANGQLQ